MSPCFAFSPATNAVRWVYAAESRVTLSHRLLDHDVIVLPDSRHIRSTFEYNCRKIALHYTFWLILL